MKTAKLKIQRKRLEDLLDHERNPRHHPAEGSRQWEAMRKSLNDSYFDPLIWNKRNGKLVSGHFRKKVMLSDLFDSADVVVVDYDEETHYARMIAANHHTGEDDEEALQVLLRELDGKIDMDMTGIDAKELESLMAIAKEEEPEEDLLDVSHALPGAHALKVDMQFESSEIYNIPAFLPDMLAPIPEGLTTWAGKDATEEAPHYFYNFGTDSVRGLNFSRTIIGFYTDDSRFEPFWQYPDIYTGKLLNRKPLAVVSPNYSLWVNMPEACKIWNTFRARWLGRYFQEAGLKLIPDINFADDKSFEYCLAGIPKNAPCISIQIQTVTKSESEIEARRSGLIKIVERLKPQAAIVYVSDGHEAITHGIFDSCQTAFIANRVQKRRKFMGRERK